MKRIKHCIIVVTLIFSTTCFSQEAFYSNAFPLKNVTLLEGPFKHAMDVNVQTLLQYDVDRLLEPFLTEAGLETDAVRFPNWDGLAGSIGGHYLSALAMSYAATNDDDIKNRMHYMLTTLKSCQEANGNGYIGGIPDGETTFDQIKAGNIQANAFSLNGKWVPWYNIHKIYAGLRDAWYYGESEVAKEMFLDLCDWGIDIISGLTVSQMQNMLTAEFGGMNEVYADAYQITNDPKYFDVAKRFTHSTIYTPLRSGIDNLNNQHANTQIPKVVGFGRMAQIDHEEVNYLQAANFFWETVVQNRTLALGGNSRAEYFPSAAACHEYTTHREGPESCNTYNMLKLSNYLFNIEQKADYIDYYENALYNHILSTQHPEHGGYVYFTPARARHYRVYSAPNMAMWCCVGTGMENHAKYGEMIYNHTNDSLFVNLFIPSVLNWEENSTEIKQETQFPYEEGTTLTINGTPESPFKLLIRYPHWVKEQALSIFINGEPYEHQNLPGSFIEIERNWSDGDKIEVSLPMHHWYEEMPNVPKYIAIKYGPILLGAKTGNQNLDGLIADDGRWSHIANGQLLPLDKAPVILGDRNSIMDAFEPIQDNPLKFKAPGLFDNQSHYESLIFEPFFNIHDARYMMYWMSLTYDEYAAILEELEQQEQEALELDRRTVDHIATGEQQPDTDHNVNGSNSHTGIHNNEYYRDARSGGFFSYELATNLETELILMARYWGNEGGNRTFDILVDETVIATENLTNKWNVNDFVNVEYNLPSHLIEEKEYITVKFQARPGHYAGGVFYLRLLTPPESTSSITTPIVEQNLFIYKEDANINIEAKYSYELTSYNIFTLNGALIYSGDFFNNKASIPANSLPKGVYIIQYTNGINFSHEKFPVY